MLTDYERRLYPLSVTVFIDPRAHILYWKPPDKSDFARMEVISFIRSIKRR